MYSLRDIILCAKSNTCALERTTRVKTLYNLYRTKILQEYSSYEDYIKIHYMSYSPNRCEKTGKLCAAKTSESVPMAFVPNKFPYNIEKNLSHYVLFSEKPLRNMKMKSVLYKLLPKKNLLRL